MSGTTIVVSYRFLPDQLDTALREIGALIATVQGTGPACRGVTMLQDANDSSRITLIELWPSQEMFLGPHMQQPHIHTFI